VAILLKELNGFRAAGRNLFEPFGEMRFVKGLVTLGRALTDERVAKEFVIAKDILRGLLIVVGRPVACIFLEIRSVGVGKIVRGKRCVVVERNQVVNVGKLLVNIVVTVVSAAVGSITAIIGVLVIVRCSSSC
jgi:hypothetical protein